MKRTKLNGQERTMLQHIAEGKSPTEAASLAYKTTSKHSAQTISSRVMHRERFIKVLERAGLTNSYIAKKFVELIDAKKPVVVKGKIIEYPDGAVQHATLKTALKIKDLLPKDEEETTFHDEPLIVQAIQFKTQIIKGKT